MFDIQTSRFYPGQTNNRDTDIFSDLYVNDRAGKIHEYTQDFDQYVAGDWTVTGAGSAALAAGDGGVLNLTSPVSTFQVLQKNPANYKMVSGYRAWFRSIASLDSLLGNTIQGLVNASATPFGGLTDGFWFTTDVTTGEVKGNAAVASAVQTVDLLTQIVAGSYYRFSAYYDGEVYLAVPNGRVVFEILNITANTSVRAEISLAAAYPGATNLAPMAAVNASTAVARVLSLDLLYAAKDRANPNATPAA